MGSGRDTRTGASLEGAVEGSLHKWGFELIDYKEWKKSPEDHPEALIRRVPYVTIYGHKGRTEYLLSSKKYSLKIRIECKWQGRSGSVDEKFPYLVRNIIETMPEKNHIVVYGGGGAKAGAIRWLKAQESEVIKYGKSLLVLNHQEFMNWASKTFANKKK